MKTVEERPAEAPVIIPLLDVEDMMRWLKVSEASVFRMMNLGLPHIKIGKCLRFRKVAVEVWLLEHEVSKRSAVTH